MTILMRNSIGGYGEKPRGTTFEGVPKVVVSKTLPGPGWFDKTQEWYYNVNTL